MIYENEEDKIRKGLVSSDLNSGVGIARTQIKDAPLQQTKHVAQAPAPQQPQQSSTGQFAKMMAGKVAQKYVTDAAAAKALGTAAGGPAGFVAATAAQHFLPELVGSFFRSGGVVRYYSNGGETVPMNQGGSMVLPPPGAQPVKGVPQEIVQMSEQVIGGNMSLDKFRQILMSMNIPQPIVKDVLQFVYEEKMKKGGNYGS